MTRLTIALCLVLCGCHWPGVDTHERRPYPMPQPSTSALPSPKAQVKRTALLAVVTNTNPPAWTSQPSPVNSNVTQFLWIPGTNLLMGYVSADGSTWRRAGNIEQFGPASDKPAGTLMVECNTNQTPFFTLAPWPNGP